MKLILATLILSALLALACSDAPQEARKPAPAATPTAYASPDMAGAADVGY